MPFSVGPFPRPPNAIIKKNGQPSHNQSQQITTLNGHQTQQEQATKDKPLNILIAIDDEVLIEQHQLEASLRLGPPKGQLPGPPALNTTPNTSWISNHIIFKTLKKQLNKFIGLSKFTIYPITRNELKSQPWPSTTVLLMMLINPRKYKDEDDFLIDTEKAIKDYINNGGLAVVYKLDDLFESTDVYSEVGFRSKLYKERLISRCGKQFFSSANKVIKFEDDDFEELLPKNTPVYLVTCDDYKELLGVQFIKDVNSNTNSKIIFVEERRKESESDEERFDDLNQPFSRIPVLLNEDIPSSVRFDFDTYYSNLASNRLGHHILYQEISPSTQTIIEPFTGLDGLVAIARQQTSGKGRGENQWLSPVGCAMFSLHLTVSLASKLGQRLGFVQHLMALAVVRAIKAIPGCEDIGKWCLYCLASQLASLLYHN